MRKIKSLKNYFYDDHVTHDWRALNIRERLYIALTILIYGKISIYPKKMFNQRRAIHA